MTCERSAFILPIESREEVDKPVFLQGRLDLLILKMLTLGPYRGWESPPVFDKMSRKGLNAGQGSLYRLSIYAS